MIKNEERMFTGQETKKEGGKTKYCMTSKDTGKTYCYDSSAERKKGIKMHEAFKHGFKPTRMA